MRHLLPALALILILPGLGLAQQAAAPPPVDVGAPPSVVKSWTHDRFGMFIHWGIYSILGRAEWVMHNEHIPVATYSKLQAQFNPKHFDADAIVRLAQAAGQKYITITTKHHDGFCMFDSKLTTYTSMHSPCHRDFVRELTDACHRHGMKIQFYYSLLDWHNPDYKKDFPVYLKYAFGQVRELCTNYGKINGIWFDGGWEHTWQQWHAPELIAMIRKLQPDCMINDRSGWGGDYSTPEQTTPGGSVKPGARPFECCYTINNSWGYNASDHAFKSPEQLVQLLATIVGRGGNLLLNIGPMATGEVPSPEVVRLRQMGEWVHKYGESIYGCYAGPFAKTPWGACTSKGNRLYIHIFDYQGGSLTLPGLQNKVKKAWVLKNGEQVRTFPADDGVVMVLPDDFAPDLCDTVVAVDLEGAPVVENLVRQADNGTLSLTAELADLHGNKLEVESKPGPGGKPVPNLGYWVDSGDWASWQIEVSHGGRFEVAIDWASDKGTGGNKAAITVGPAKLVFTTEETGSWDKFEHKTLGTIDLPAGKYDVTVKPIKMNIALMNLRSITLTPTD